MSVATKNPYELLREGDVNSEDSQAPKSASERGAKPDAPKSGPRQGVTGNEAAYRDHGAGSASNRRKPTDEAPRGHRGGYHARVRGGRGSGHPRTRDDRHSKHLPSGSEKQAAQSWGQPEGKAELKDEQAGEEIAQAEKKEGDEGDDKNKEAPAEPARPEERSISYADYLTHLASKKLSLDSEMNIRKANEGTKLDKKWANAQPLVKNEDQVYVEPTGGKTKRERERKQKNILEIDQRYIEPERNRRGRGGRGSRVRGGEFRGRGSRGGGGGVGGAHGGRQGDNIPIDTQDQVAFPSLRS